MIIEDMTPEQKERALACKTPEEVFALAKEDGLELTQEEFETVSGGSTCWDNCPDASGCSTHRCGIVGWE